ncbi:Uma2 family endonuclease [Calothrix sp. NIES-3974]|uniref:Uma2 family endonuclease n=1 Tax=Calothrix sp. NIES-3974 TaxID=2005462 RepID=UPI000B613E52|nr:hypothetical protein NIES3974_25740 [Calothrix sp. NIES-3974]
MKNLSNFYPENSPNKYELDRGIITEIPPPNGKHEGVLGFLAGQITFQFMQMGLPYRIPKTAFVKIPETETLYLPDILIQNYNNVVNEPLWEHQPILCSPVLITIPDSPLPENELVKYKKQLFRKPLRFKFSSSLFKSST